MDSCPSVYKAKLKDRQGAVGKEKTVSEECGMRRNLRRSPGGAQKCVVMAPHSQRGREEFMFSWKKVQEEVSFRKGVEGQQVQHLSKVPPLCS